MPPASTADELRDVLIEYEAQRPRTMQVELGPSEIGGECVAQIVRKLAGFPEKKISEPEWSSIQGTAMHAMMADVLEFWNRRLGRQRFLIEHEVRIDDTIIGHSDVYDTDEKMVIDWKYTGVTARKKLLTALRKQLPTREQVSQVYRVQTHLYGWGFERLGYAVDWVRLVLLPRSSQYRDVAEWTEQYNGDLVDWAVKRYNLAREAAEAIKAAEMSIEQIPIHPGDECGRCPFLLPGRHPFCGGDVAQQIAAANFMEEE